MRKNCHKSGGKLLYIFVERVVILTALSIQEYYNIVSNVHPSMSGPDVGEIIGHHQCGFRRSRSTTDQIFCIPQILKNMYSGTVRQLFIDFEKAHNSVIREVLYNIPNEFGIPIELVRLIKMYLNET
jgi:hypothetical protein